MSDERKNQEPIAERMKTAAQHYFGGCPECGDTDGYVNVGGNHWFVCDKHRTKWPTGYNLFSSWKEETEADWQKNAQLLDGYEKVKPLRVAD